MIAILAIGLILLMTFGLVVFIGPPFVRTHKQSLHSALDLLKIKKGSHLLDLGSGDGAVLLAAARRGAKATGYEANPIMWLISKWRTRGYTEQITIHFGDMWKAPIDTKTENIYVFLDTRFIERFDRKIQDAQCGVSVASYSYKIPGRDILQTKNGVHLYRYGRHL